MGDPRPVGRLGGPRGGRGADPLGALSDLRELRELGVRCLASLTESARGFGPLCEQAGLEWLFSPIPEFGVPDDEKAFDELMRELRRRLEQGAAVCVHCYAGSGARA
ncbi:hypothetical protein LDC_0532, partial [sediment metagenome]